MPLGIQKQQLYLLLKLKVWQRLYCIFFSRVGIPEEIVTDRGSQFTSQMMDEVRRIMSVEHLPTTPYHAMANGLVEKFNGTLKSMLKKMCAEQPKD